MSGNGDKSEGAKTGLICPLMSGQLVMTETQPGGVVTPGKPILTPSVVVCVEERCRWWHNPNRCCVKIQEAEATLQVALSVIEVKTALLQQIDAIQALALSVVGVKNALEPLRLLIGSLRRLCDKLNDVTLTLEQEKG